MIAAAFLLACTQVVNAQVSEQVSNNYNKALNPETTLGVVAMNDDFHQSKPSRYNYWALQGYVGNSTRPCSFEEQQVQGLSLEASAVGNYFNGFYGIGPSAGLMYKTKKYRIGAEYALLINRYNDSAATPNKHFQSHKVTATGGISLWKSPNACSELEIIGRVLFFMMGDDIAQQAEAERLKLELEGYEHTYSIGGDGGFRYTQRVKHTGFYMFLQGTCGAQGNLTYENNKIQMIAEVKFGIGFNISSKKRYNTAAMQYCRLSESELWNIYKSQKKSDKKQIFDVTY